MGWGTIYLIANYWAIAFWLLLAFAPRGPRILSAVLYAGVFLLCLAYTILIAGFLTGGIDPGGAGGDFMSLETSRKARKDSGTIAAESAKIGA